MKRVAKFLRTVLLYGLTAAVLIGTAGLSWLRWESHQPRDAWFDERRGRIQQVALEEAEDRHGQISALVKLDSDSGLSVSFRIIRNATAEPLPVLLVIGGQRTGRDAVDLFGKVGSFAVVALDYPYDGPERLRGLGPVLKAIPLARRAFLDTPPAISLVVDWLAGEHWVDSEQLIIIGVSLGVPFAAAAAARDHRIASALLVHGAADNEQWLKTQIAQRIDTEILHQPLATVLYWLAYGPLLDASANVAKISPRQVLIIGARHDERTPVSQTEQLYAAAREPKSLRWTDGRHVQPGRDDVVRELLRIAEEELSL